ncbi:MAG TPA: hypothetical protein VLJ59_19555 [Mycobacteriales bacterium]|nr:hypothetical protein [Mycobacteriales bacterium]
MSPGALAYDDAGTPYLGCGGHGLVNHSLNAHRVIRLTPPAVLTEADLTWLLDALAGAARAIAVRHTRPMSA